MIVRLTTLDQMRRKSIVFLLLGLLQFHHISARIITSRNFLEFNTNAPLESTGTAEDESQNVMVLKTNIVVSECNNGIQCSEQSPPDEDETDENSSEGEPAPSDHTPLSKKTETYPPLNPNTDPYAPLNPNTDPYAPLNPNTDHYAPQSQNNPHLSQNTDTYPPLNPNTDPYAPLNPNTNHYAPLSQNNPHLSQNTDTYPPLNPNTDPYAPLNPNTDPYAPLSQNNPPLRQNTDTYPPLNPNTDTYAPLNKDTYTRPSQNQNQTPPMRRFKAEPKVLHNKVHDVHPAHTEVINHFINEHSNTVIPFYAGQPLQYIAVETTPVRPTTLLPTTVPEESGVNTAEGGTTESPQVEDEEDDEEDDDDDDEEEEKEQATAGDTRDMAITTPAVPSTTTSSRPEVSTTMPPTVLTQKTMPATLHHFTSTTTTASTSTLTTVTTTTIPPVTKGDRSSAAPSTSPTSTTQPTSPTTTSQPTTSTTTIQSTSPTTTIQPTSRTTIIHSTSSTTIQSTSSTTTIQPTSSTTKIQSTSSTTTTIQPTSSTSTVRPSSTSSASPTKPKTPAPVKSTVKSLTTLRTTLTTTLTPPTVPKEVKPHFTTTVVRAPTTVITTITTEKPQRRTITSTRPPTKTPTPTTVKPQRRTTIKRRRVVSISSRPPPPTTTTETTTTSLPTTTSTRRPLITVKRIKPQPKVTTLKPLEITTLKQVAYVTTLKPLEITTLKQVAHVTTQVKPLVSSIQTINKYITPARVTSTHNKHSDTDDGKNNISGSFREETNSTKVKDICAECMMKHGVGYMEHPDSCTHFYQCIRRTHPVPDVVVERTCPLGLYWNQAVLTCDYPSNVQCGKDICSPSTLKSIDGNCRGFFECSGGISVPRCCPSLHRFHPSSSLCIPDDLCNDDCPMTHKHNFTCDMRAIPGDRFAFEQKTAWNKWVHRKCPILTAFSEDICGCSMSAPDNTDLDCKPQLYIPFDNSTDDESGNHVHVRNKGVAVHDGYGHFDGKSHLKITRFSNGWFGDTVIVSVRYKQEGVSRHERQALVCNGDCDVHPSLYLGVADTDTEFFVKTYSSAAVNFTVPASASVMNHHAWQDVTYLLADGTLEGNVRGVSIAQKVKGAVETRQRALMIGGCEGAEGFQGSIDQIAIYLCKPKGR